MPALQLVHSLTPLHLGGDSSLPRWVMQDGSGRLLASGEGDSWQDLARERSLGAGQVEDGSGLYLTESFTDIHCHGGGGVAFEDAPAVESALEVHAAAGTTGIVASLVTNPLPQLEATLAQLAGLMNRPAPGARLLGIHAEGPFLSPAHKGAHNPDFLLAPTADQVERLFEASEGTLKQITLAPELDEGLAATRRCVELGIKVAVGHTDADYARAKAAFDEGASLLTHTFNAMRPLHHRLPGPVAAAADSGHVTLELIVDGVHVHAPMVRAAFALAPGRVALITDAMAAAGCADGHYMLGSLDVDVEDSVARISGTDTIAGSTLTLGSAVERAVAFGVPLADAVAAATVVPRSALGLPATGFNVVEPDGSLRVSLSL